MELRAAKASEFEEIADLQQCVFRPHQPESKSRYLAYAKGDPTFTLEHARVIEVDGRLVAHLRIWDRTLNVNGVELFAAGIGSLCVHPDYRKRGYAQALMHDSERYFFQAGYDLGLLFTIIGTPFYEALDWIPIPLSTFAFDVADESREVADVRKLDVAQDLQAVMELYNTYGKGYSGTANRDRDYWTSDPAQIRSLFPQWGVIQNGDLVAFMNIWIEEEEVWVNEVCGVPGVQPAYSELAGVALEYSKGKRLGGSLPRDHAFVNTLETMTQTKAVWDIDDHMMVKGVNWDTLREKLGNNLVPNPPPTAEGEFWTQVFGENMYYWETDVF
jgi:predicted N-acetyltransferase YhbS